ncbi:MAG: oligopeptide transport system substrate-binding protein, partial [Planctomycetota bacterium]
MRAMKVAWIILFATMLVSCGFSGDAGRKSPGVLVVNNMADPSFLDPGLQSAAEDQRITLALFEGLVVPHPKTLRPLPGVAAKWAVSRDGLTYSFDLRPCLWSDGVAVSAQDFLYAWRRALTPQGSAEQPTFQDQSYYISAPYVDVLYVIKGAKDWHQGRLKSFEDVGIRVIDDLHLEVVLAQPTPWFLELLSFPTYAPVPRHVVERFQKQWTRPENLVGNGPFNLVLRNQGDLLRVRRSETYWDRANVGLEGIDYLSTDQVDTAIDQFLAGESDWVRSFNPKKVRAWLADKELSTYLRAPEFLATFFFRLNMSDSAFSDPRVRQALSLAIDREAITRYVTGLGE